jgi:hypothetical protein
MDLGPCRLAYGDRDATRCAWCGDPIPAGRRRWCSERCSRGYTVNHYWPAARAFALADQHHRCAICGDPEDLEVHHDPPVARRRGYGNGCQHHQDRLLVLCSYHHHERHKALRARPGTTTQLSLLDA